MKQDNEKFQVGILEKELGIENVSDQYAIIGALKYCLIPPPPEKYLIGYFREDEDLDCVTNREKKAIKKKLDGTMAQLLNNFEKDAVSL